MNELLCNGEVEVLGLLANASNATFLAQVTSGSESTLAVYKPRRGERPLWDFPDGTLCVREYAAWVIDDALGWGLVPETVLRDGPAGFGALQTFIEVDAEADVRGAIETHEASLRRMAAFDALTNNADRKAGHLLIDTDRRLWGVDHGLCFNVEEKLRTVIWAFEGEEIEAEVLADIERVVSEPPAALTDLLDPIEMDALRMRGRTLLQERSYPSPRHGGPAVPWPPW